MPSIRYYIDLIETAALELPTIEVGDTVMVGRWKNRKATIKGFTADQHNQPVLKTNKGDQKLFKPRLTKLMNDERPMDETRRYTPGDYERILNQQRELEGLRAAMRDPKTGQVYVGSSHQAAIDKVPQSDETGAWGRLSNEWYNGTENSGFVDIKTGQFISRDEANRRWDVLTIEDVRDKLRAARGKR